MLGGYNIKVCTTSLPQNVASGFDNAFDGLKFTGAEYEMIAYLGKQQVNGYNHAFLALQKLVTKDDVKNIVLVILNEKPGDVGGNTFSVVEIRRLLADGSNLMGGVNVAPTTKIPEDAMKTFNERFGGGLFGATTKPIALLATQVVNGVAYYFATESTLVTGPVGNIDVMANKPEHVNINIVKIFSNYHDIETKLVLEGTKEILSDNATVDNSTRLSSHLTNGVRSSYAFNW